MPVVVGPPVSSDLVVVVDVFGVVVVVVAYVWHVVERLNGKCYYLF